MNDRILALLPVSGISGDMFSASLLDLLLHNNRADDIDIWENSLRKFVSSLRRPFHFTAVVKEVSRNNMRGTLLKFDHEESDHSRLSSEIRRDIRNSELDPAAADKAISILDRLSAAEAGIHGCEPDEVHLHEAGSEDSILDIVSAAILHGMLGSPAVTTYTSLPFTIGGTVQFSHGTVAIPAPATAELMKGMAVHLMDSPRELVTPTGAAILAGIGAVPVKTLADVSGDCTVIGNGSGAGSADLKGIANLLRCVLLERRP